MVLIEPCLGHVLSSDDLANIALLEDLKFLRSANTASEWENSALSWVNTWSWMSDSKRAVDAIAVLERRVPATIVAVVVVAWLAEVMGAKAAEECRGATVHALPIDLDVAMNLTVGLTSTDFLE